LLGLGCIFVSYKLRFYDETKKKSQLYFSHTKYLYGFVNAWFIGYSDDSIDKTGYCYKRKYGGTIVFK
jgi:hypothetical protein